MRATQEIRELSAYRDRIIARIWLKAQCQPLYLVFSVTSHVSLVLFSSPAPCFPQLCCLSLTASYVYLSPQFASGLCCVILLFPILRVAYMIPAWIYSFCFYRTEIVQMIVSEVRVIKKGTFVTGQ